MKCIFYIYKFGFIKTLYFLSSQDWFLYRIKVTCGGLSVRKSRIRNSRILNTIEAALL